MHKPKIVILGGGLSGMAAAYMLAEAGMKDITLVEQNPALGGLAGSFERNGRCYPLAYHHILHHDHALLYFLDRIGVLERVRWRKIRMLFYLDGRLHDLGSLAGFARFPMPITDKLRFIRLMLKAFTKSDWSDWEGRSAADLVDAWASPGVRAAVFEPLTRLKFELSCKDVSAAWLGKRLYYREGFAPLGYIPDTNWTRVLCDGMAHLLEETGCRVLLDSTVDALTMGDGRIREAKLSNGTRITADLFVNALPVEALSELLPRDGAGHLENIRNTALISALCGTRQTIRPDFYWMNLLSLPESASAIYMLSSLNPTLGEKGESCLNFVTHLKSRNNPLFTVPDIELMARYSEYFREIFGFHLDTTWTRIIRIPLYSPVFLRDYRNPPVQSPTWRNLYLTGIIRTHPSVASTGCALESGVETGRAILKGLGRETDLLSAMKAFRLKRMPRG